MGAEPLLGSLGDIEILRRGSANSDGVVHLAFGLDLSQIVQLAQEDRQAIETFGEIYSGSNRPVIITSGFGLVPKGEIFREEGPIAPINPVFPRASEQTAFALAEKGVRATWVRLPRSVHGVGEQHGFVPMLANLARSKGFSAYIGDGENLWPSVHRLDAARVFQLALEHGAEGGPFHAVAEDGVPVREIAAAIGNRLGLPTQSIPPEKADEHFGPLAMWVAGHGPASSLRTRARLAWEPRESGLIQDIKHPGYLA